MTPSAGVDRSHTPRQWRVRYEVHQDLDGQDPQLMVSGTFHVVADTVEEARRVAHIKAEMDYAIRMFDNTTISLSEPELKVKRR